MVYMTFSVEALVWRRRRRTTDQMVLVRLNMTLTMAGTADGLWLRPWPFRPFAWTASNSRGWPYSAFTPSVLTRQEATILLLQCDDNDGWEGAGTAIA